MRVSGLSILRNVVRFGYPFRESIASALPLCDEFVVVVGDSDDGTLEAVKAMQEPKVRIVETHWSENIRPQRHVLAQQTNVGLHMCRGDWVVYLQANEVLHESSLSPLEAAMHKHLRDERVEALLLERLEFWGDYSHMLRVYPHRFKFSPRVLRPHIGTYAIRDAMSVAVFDNFSRRGRYPRAVDTGQDLFRYGNVRSPEQFADKARHAVHLSDVDGGASDHENFFYKRVPRSFVRPFGGSHPAVMAERVGTFAHSISLEDPRWRTRVTWHERQRTAETWFYERFGLPRVRNTRYSLVGSYADKPRPA